MQKKIKYNKIKIYVDFDGTITKKDIGNDFFKFLIGQNKFYNLYNKFINSEIDIKTYWKLLFEEVNLLINQNSNALESLSDNNIDQVINLTVHEQLDKIKNISQYLENCEIDDYFLSFISYLKKINLEPTIISDGFDIYIKPILLNNEIKVNYECNSIKLINDNFLPKILPKFKLESESCNCLTANCKKNLILKDYTENDLLIYIGDGISDYCPIEYCDIIFAKGKLSQYCNNNNIPHHNFNNFFDVLSIFKTYFTTKTKILKIRNQAYIKRKLAFEIE